MAVAEKARWHNRKDEAYILLSLYLSLSLELIFHLDGLTCANYVWIKLESLFGKQDEIRGKILENELIALHPNNIETIPNFFTKFKSLALIRGNLGSKMGLIRKRAKISFCELEFKNQ